MRKKRHRNVLPALCRIHFCCFRSYSCELRAGNSGRAVISRELCYVTTSGAAAACTLSLWDFIVAFASFMLFHSSPLLGHISLLCMLRHRLVGPARRWRQHNSVLSSPHSLTLKLARQLHRRRLLTLYEWRHANRSRTRYEATRSHLLRASPFAGGCSSQTCRSPV